MYSERFFLVWIAPRDLAGTRTQDPYIKSVLLYQLSYQISFPLSKNGHKIPCF